MADLSAKRPSLAVELCHRRGRLERLVRVWRGAEFRHHPISPEGILQLTDDDNALELTRCTAGTRLR